MSADISQEELDQIAKVFKELNIKPKADTAQDFKQWMTQYVAQMNEEEFVNVKTEPHADTGTSSASASGSSFSSHIPKISCFSGDGSKNDTTYDLWRYEVDCLIKEKCKEEIIAQSIRRSLRGDAGKVAMRLGPGATVTQILDKMESVFGTIERGETIMEQFYSARQEKGEDSMSWSCRLEEIYRKAVIKGVATKEDANEKLRSKFWNGLHQWIKDITGYKFDALTNFDELRKEIRLVEKEHETKKAQSNMAVTSSEAEKGDEIKELKGMIQQLTTKVSAMEQQRTNRKDLGESYGRFPPPQSKRGNGAGNLYRGHPNFKNYSGPRYPQAYNYDYYYGYNSQESAQTEDEEPIICYKCRQPGHIARYCQVRMDHSRRYLNVRRPSLRGKR